jgi:predicted AlkP superfamily pyrophosphatase or phosphodiesterase
VAANPLAADLGKTWDRLLQESQYLGVDDGIAEAAPEGWTRTFPHVLKGKDNKADGTYRLQWERSPFGDAYLGRFAASLVESLKLGQHDGTDVLTVGFSSTDLVGHNFGPRSQEVQDMYAHLDRTVGALLDRLDALVGRGQYVVALSADHGVTPIPEQLTVDGQDAGRINQEVVKGVIEQQLKAAWGPASGWRRSRPTRSTLRLASTSVSRRRRPRCFASQPGSPGFQGFSRCFAPSRCAAARPHRTGCCEPPR